MTETLPTIGFLDDVRIHDTSTLLNMWSVITDELDRRSGCDLLTALHRYLPSPARGVALRFGTRLSGSAYVYDAESVAAVTPAGASRVSPRLVEVLTADPIITRALVDLSRGAGRGSALVVNLTQETLTVT